MSYFICFVRSCDAGSCDPVIGAIQNGLKEWESITMETGGIDYYHSYQLLQKVLHISSLLLQVSSLVQYKY